MNLKKITENLFYAVVFFLPWQAMWLGREVWMGGFKWEYGVIGVYGVDILVGLLLMVSAVRYFEKFNLKFLISNFKSIFNNKILNYKTILFISSSLVFIWSLAAIFWSVDRELAGYFSGKLVLALGLFWVVKKIEFSWKKLVVVLLLAGALQGALGVGQFLLQGTFSSKWLGMSAHQTAQGGASVLENSSGRWLRAYGSFPHPNILGGYLAIILLIIIIQNTSKSQKISINKYFMLYVICYMIIFSGLIVSFSRSAWLVFALGWGILFWLQKERRRELVKMLLIFIVTALIWLSAFSPLFLARTQGEARLEKKSVDDRVEYVVQAKEITREHFWLGVGAGNYTNAVREKNPQKKIWEIQPVHNVFLLVSAELGLVGLTLWLIFLGSVFLMGYKKNKIFTLVLYASCFMLYVLDHWLWTSHFGLLFFFLLLGLVLGEENFKEA
jgi:O-antigen ligase